MKILFYRFARFFGYFRTTIIEISQRDARLMASVLKNVVSGDDMAVRYNGEDEMFFKIK